jgi:hypothetical protein
VDYVCPFSAKIARAIDGVLKPLVDDGGAYAGKVKVIFRPQVQPWHASSTFVHEAGIAVRTATVPCSRGSLACTGCPHSARGLLAVLACGGRPVLAALGGDLTNLQLFKDQEKYYDVPTSTQTPVEIRASLAQLAASVLGDAKAREFHGLLELKGSPNGGTSVTDDLKYTSTS